MKKIFTLAVAALALASTSMAADNDTITVKATVGQKLTVKFDGTEVALSENATSGYLETTAVVKVSTNAGKDCDLEVTAVDLAHPTDSLKKAKLYAAFGDSKYAGTALTKTAKKVNAGSGFEDHNIQIYVEASDAGAMEPVEYKGSVTVTAKSA